MKKKILLFEASIIALLLTSCDPGLKNPTIPNSFPKKHLIEEFTGQDCGYCPYGMDCISEFVQNDSNWITILHHYGYQSDNFSVPGSSKITSQLKVQGAPSMSINRQSTQTQSGSVVTFHPGYLPEISKSQFASTTYVSIVIKNEYDPSTRDLFVRVSGDICKEDYPNLKLTVLIKESGMVDYQSDYYNTFLGWQEFRHTNAVRAYLSNALGELITVNEKRHYSTAFAITLQKDWKPENCMVVAFLSEDFNPVVQAEQRPVVTGSNGGADIKHGGITKYPVADYYPEPSASAGPSDYMSMPISMTKATAGYSAYPEYGFNYWVIQAYNTTQNVSVNNTTCIPFAEIYLFTELNQKTLPVGTYTFNTSMTPNSAYSGYRDDTSFSIGGSMFYYTSLSYFQQNYLVPVTEWLIAEGTLTIGTQDWELIGKSRNGSDIHLVSTNAITNRGEYKAPRKSPARDIKIFEPTKIQDFRGFILQRP